MKKPLRAWLFVLCVVILASVVWLYSESRPVHKTGKNIEVIITPGETSTHVAQDLQRQGLIKNALVFELYLWKTGGSRYLQAGRYLVGQGTGIEELALVFEHGRVTRDVITIVVPEGFTVKQIADRLQKSGICSAKAFIQSEQSDRFDEPFLKKVPQNKQVKFRLEGYLFPATYQMERRTPAHAVVDQMLQTFNDNWETVLQQGLKQSHMTLAQVVTEASLIEKEAKVDAERPVIASVIHNRLVHQPPMKLQIDATLEYILGYRSIITDRDLQVKDPYNTYMYAGMPPGPICNPGLASMKAVLHPASTNYLYYVVKNNKSGEHYFSSTYAQQLHNETLSQENLRKYASQ